MLPHWRPQLPDGTEVGCLLAGMGQGKRPALLLLSEIFGVNAAMAEAAQALAREGYIVAAPDPYARTAPGTALLYSSEERDIALGLWAKLDLRQSVRDLSDLAAIARELPDCNGQVAAVGFCLGGQLALLAAIDGTVDAAVAFYPVGVADYAHRLPGLRRPVQAHVGDSDPHLPKDLRNILKNGLAAADSAELRIYPGADHGFYNAVRTSGFHPEHAAAAHQAMVSFLKGSLADQSSEP